MESGNRFYSHIPLEHIAGLLLSIESLIHQHLSSHTSFFIYLLCLYDSMRERASILIFSSTFFYFHVISDHFSITISSDCFINLPFCFTSKFHGFFLPHCHCHHQERKEKKPKKKNSIYV